MPFLHQIGDRQAVMSEFRGDGDDEPHVGGGQLVQRTAVAVIAPGDRQQFFLFSFEKGGVSRRLHQLSAESGKIRHGQFSIARYLKCGLRDIRAF